MFLVPLSFAAVSHESALGKFLVVALAFHDIREVFIKENSGDLVIGFARVLDALFIGDESKKVIQQRFSAVLEISSHAARDVSFG